MAKGKDERHNPSRKVSRNFTKWHVMHRGETMDIHDSEEAAQQTINELVRNGTFESNDSPYVEKRVEDLYGNN